MIVHLVVYSALIKNNELSFPDRSALDFCVGLPLFQNYEWVLPKFAEKYSNGLTLIRLGRLYQY